MKKQLGVGILSLALLAPTAALACGGGKGHGHRAHRGKRGAHFKKMISQLNLSDAQKSQVAALRTQNKAERQALRGQLRNAKTQLRSLLQTQSPNEPAVMAQMQTVNDLRFKMKKLRVKSMLQFQQLLTPAQQAQLAQLKQARRAKWKAKRKAWREKRNATQQAQ